MKIIPVEAILERDIDILLLEELNSNIGFLNWIIGLLELPYFEKTEGSWRSISAFDLGETDILVSYLSGSRRIFLLIENKIDADFQDKQQFRYQQRGKEYIASGHCDEYHCLLVAPGNYISSQQDFGLTISYEQIRNWFRDRKESRFDFKASLLEIAIEKLRRGYRAVNNAAVQKFWNLYWESKNQLLPELEMKKPTVVPIGSDWIQLSNRNLKQLNITIFHKLGRGHIDAQLSQHQEDKINKIKSSLPTDLKIEKTGKSVSIRNKTEPLNRMEDFEVQFITVKKAFEDIRILNSWIEENKKHWV